MIEGLTVETILGRVIFSALLFLIVYGGIWLYYKYRSKKSLAIEEKVEEIPQEETTTDVVLTPSPERHYCNKDCNICRSVIGYDKYTKKGGYYMHKSCFKQQKRMAGI